MVMVWRAGSQATSPPNDSEMTRRGTIERLFLMYGAASTAVTLPSTVTMSVPTVRTMTLLTATGTVVIVTTPAALMATAAVVVRPEAYAETLPVSAAPYVMRPCAGATLETTATASVSVQAACVV